MPNTLAAANGNARYGSKSISSDENNIATAALHVAKNVGLRIAMANPSINPFFMSPGASISGIDGDHRKKWIPGTHSIGTAIPFDAVKTHGISERRVLKPRKAKNAYIPSPNAAPMASPIPDANLPSRPRATIITAIGPASGIEPKNPNKNPIIADNMIKSVTQPYWSDPNVT